MTALCDDMKMNSNKLSDISDRL